MIKKLSIATLISFFLCQTAGAGPIISGISNNEINIDTSFKGAKILLFGAKNDAGNVIVSVRGPRKDFLVNKKKRIFGIWYNAERIKFQNSPSFYSLFSAFKNDEASPETLEEFEIGENNIKFDVLSSIDQKTKSEFQRELIQFLESKKLYNGSTKNIDFLDESLFKVLVEFPKNIALGVYSVEIYLINQGSISALQSIPIYVNQVGLNSEISNFSTEQPVIYGVLAVIFALFAGWLTNYIFARFFVK